MTLIGAFDPAGTLDGIAVEHVQETAWISQNRGTMAPTKAGTEGARNAHRPLTNRPGISRRSAVGIVRVPLRHGKTLLLDEEDHARFGRYHLHQPDPREERYYARVFVAPKRPAYLHRLILCAGSGQVVDHIDGNGLNNARDNLRLVSQATNNQHIARIRRTNSTGYVGVFFDRACQGWRASASVGDRTKYLGTYETPEQAARVYDAFVRDLHGPLAFVNFPEEAAS